MAPRRGFVREMGRHVFLTNKRAVETPLARSGSGEAEKMVLHVVLKPRPEYFKFSEGFCMARSSREAARRLAILATDQGGYFTAKQGKDAGYDYPH